jgi:hypothetical protein
MNGGVGKLPDAEPPTQVAGLQAFGKGAVTAVLSPLPDAAHAASPPRGQGRHLGRFDSSLGFAFVDEEYDIDVLVLRSASEEKRIPQASRDSGRHQEATPLHASRAQVLKAQPDIAPRSGYSTLIPADFCVNAVRLILDGQCPSHRASLASCTLILRRPSPAGDRCLTTPFRMAASWPQKA